MALEVASWNMLNAFSDPERMPRAVERVKVMDPDVAFFPEAFNADAPRKPEVYGQAVEQFQRLGYQTLSVGYSDHDEYANHLGMLAISRQPHSHLEQVRYNTRDGIKVSLGDATADPKLVLFGLHLDHRFESIRMTQIDDLLTRLVDKDQPTVLAGDFNAMPGSLWRARLLRHRAMRAFSRAIPHPHIQHLAISLTDMASGRVMDQLQAAGFQDGDPTAKSTMLSALPVVQLDHIMYTSPLKVDNHRVWPYLSVSDHRAISARVTY